MKEFKMFVITHKGIRYKLAQDYVPIQVGESNTKLDLPYIKDNTGINISEKNANYCELTAIYWLYKNYNLPDYVGICHYRRFFVHTVLLKLIDRKYVKRVMKKNDIILPNKFQTNSSAKENFINSKSGREKDLNNLRKIIEKNYPEYLDDYDDIMQSNKISYCNMAVMKKNDFKEYCNWLFEILFKVEKITDMTGYSKQEKRLYGFLSEFLLNVWVLHNKLKVKYCWVYKYREELSTGERIWRRIKFMIKVVIKNQSN